MVEQSRGIRIILTAGIPFFHRRGLCNAIRRTFHGCGFWWIIGCPSRWILLESVQQDCNLYKRSSQMEEGYSALLPLTATHAKYIHCDFDRKASLRKLLFRARIMKSVHLELPVHAIEKWLNEYAKAMYTKHRENLVVQYLQDLRFVFIDALRLFTRWFRVVRTTVLESLCIGKKFFRICERFRKKPLLHLANQIKCLWNDFWCGGVQRESRGQLIPAF